MPNVSNAPAVQKPQAVAPVTINSLMSNQAVKARFEDILGKKAAGFMSSVISVAKSPSLVGADPNTVTAAALIAATLDLPVNPNLGFAYIVPYNNKGKDGITRKEAQFQMGWRGFYQLALNSGIYEKITANEVYEGELVVKNRFTEEFEFAEAKSDKVVGYLAYYKTKSGMEKYYYMSREDVERHAKKYSQSYRNDKYNSSQWSQNFDAMAKKTVLKLLLSKYGKLSIEMQMAQKFDQAVVHTDTAPEDINFEEVEPEYIDNQSDDQPEPTQQKSVQQMMREAAENIPSSAGQESK